MTLCSLREQFSTCTKCDLHATRTNVVFGEGEPDNPILMIVGEGPGQNEDIEGRPFVGECGKKLDQMIKYAGLERAETYISNAVLCRPPSNRNPLMAEIMSCRGRLLEEIRLVKPKIIVTMGKIALQAVAGKPMPGALSKYFDVRFRDMSVDGNMSKLVITYHPSYLLRSRKQAFPPMHQHWTDIKNEVIRIRGS